MKGEKRTFVKPNILFDFPFEVLISFRRSGICYGAHTSLLRGG